MKRFSTLALAVLVTLSTALAKDKKKDPEEIGNRDVGKIHPIEPFVLIHCCRSTGEVQGCLRVANLLQGSAEAGHWSSAVFHALPRQLLSALRSLDQEHSVPAMRRNTYQFGSAKRTDIRCVKRFGLE